MGLQQTIKLDTQSAVPLWPYRVVEVIEEVMQEGENAGKEGWENDFPSFHIHRAQAHLENYFTHAGDDEDHLAHAFCRLMMAIAVERGYVGDEKEDGDA